MSAGVPTKPPVKPRKRVFILNGSMRSWLWTPGTGMRTGLKNTAIQKPLLVARQSKMEFAQKGEHSSREAE